MAVYVLIEVAIRDAASYEEYKRQVPATIERHGGRYLVRGGRVMPVAGDWCPERLVVLEFPSSEHVRRWASSPEYLALVPLRDRGAQMRAVAVEGYEAG